MTPMSIPRRRFFAHAAAAVLGLAVSISAMAQPTVQIGLFPSAENGKLDVRLKANGNFDELLSNLLFTISWPTSSGITLDNSQLLALCSRIPIVPNGDGVQQSGGRSYQTYFMLSLQTLAGGCPLVSGQELTVMRVPVAGLSACTDLSIANDGYTAAQNKNYYISLNGQDRTGSIYKASAQLCACSTIALDIATDGQPTQTGWEFYNGNGQLLASGHLAPGQTNRNVRLAACRNGGCYRVRLTDSAGNGISGGGYTIKVNGDRVIDATGQFGSASSLANNGTFCIAMGPTFLKPPFQDLTGIAVNAVLSAKKITGADSYTFWIFDPHGTFDTTIVRTGTNLKFTANLMNRIPQNLSLNVRVNARTGGVYGPFGKACTAMFGGAQMLALAVQEVDGPDAEALSVYPNPIADGAFHVRYEPTGSDKQVHAVIELFSSTGQQVLGEEVSFTGALDQVLQLPEGTASGVYMLTFTTSRERMVRRVVKP